MFLPLCIENDKLWYLSVWLQAGYWELTTELGQFMNINVHLFANVFLKNKGICSLGEHFLNLFQAYRVEIALLFLIKLSNSNFLLGVEH